VPIRHILKIARRTRKETRPILPAPGGYFAAWLFAFFVAFDCVFLARSTTMRPR
jgi:hypothetical protein